MLINSVPPHSLLHFSFQDEAQHSAAQDVSTSEGLEEEEDLTGIHSSFRCAADRAQTQIEVDQVRGVKIS